MSRLYGSMYEGGIPSLVHDIMESHYGEAFSLDRLVLEVRLRRPNAKPATIRRAVYRLLDRGMCERIIYRGDRHYESSRFLVRERTYWHGLEDTA